MRSKEMGGNDSEQHRKTVITIDRVYALPTVMAEIKEGRAMISGLENEDTALKISEALNGR